MKKTLLTLTLVAAVSSAFGQGAIAFNNNGAQKISTVGSDGATGRASVPLTAGFAEYGIFFGKGSSASLSLLTTQFGVNSTTGLGLIANTSGEANNSLLGNVPLPGTVANETDVWVQIKGWSASFGTDWVAAQAAWTAGQANTFFGASAVVNVNSLFDTSINGTPIWQGSTGTNPNLIKAFSLVQAIVPEPGSLALAGLGAAALMIFRRRK